MTGAKIDSHEHNLPLLEINTFGEVGNVRTCVIYWDWNGHVRDWRWWSEALRPDEVRPRLWYSSWLESRFEWDTKAMRSIAYRDRFTVYARKVIWTRSDKDREVEDRVNWPLERRRLL